MGVLSRLRDFTADRDATPPVAISAEGMDNEFDQLIAESNAQNTRLGTNETRLTTLEAPGNVGTSDLADDSITPEKTSFVDDTLVATDTHIMVGDGTDFGNVAVSGDATLANTGALTISNDAVTTAKVLDANVTLGKLQNATATNKILGRVSTGTGSYEEVDLQTNLTSTDEAIPTSKAVRDDIVSLVNDVGGFVAVADDQSFPNANPDPDDGAGTVVSIANAGGLVVDGSGVTTTGKTLGGSTITISGVPSNFYSSTIDDGLGMQVITTSTLNTYTFHRITAKEVDISTVSTNITNVNNVGNNITNVGLIAGQISPTNNISTLGGINSDITTVSGIASDVSTVSSANSNITTCADNISGINSFGERYRVGASDPTSSLDTGDLFFNSTTNELKAYGASSWQNTAPSATDQNNINIVAGDVVHSEDMGSIADAITTGSGNGDITTCATNIGNIGSVAGNSANINLVGNSISNVNATGGSISAVNTISTNISSVNSVSTNIASVNTCAADMSKIVETANDLQEAVSEIDTVATNIGNVNAVGNDIANVNAVASDSTDIGVVAGKATEIGLLGNATTVSNLGQVGTAQAISDMGTCATSISDIGTVAGVATGINFFTDRYRVSTNAPTTSLDSGDLWWDETNSELRAYSGSAWQATAPSAVNQVHINNVSGALVYSEDLGSIADGINTSSTTGDIATVANGMSDINTVANSSNLTNINLVGADITNVGLVGNSIANVNTTAGINTEIGNVSAVASDVSTVSGIASDVSAVSAKATEVGLLGQASTVTAIGNLGTTQTVSDLNACSSNASDISAVAGVASGINFFTDRYRIGTTDPTTDNDAGDLFFNTATGELRAYSTSWQATAPSAANQQAINNVSGALVYEDDLGSIADAISTSSSTGDIGTVSDNIDEVARLGTVQAVGDMQTLGTATNVGHLQTVSGSISHVQTVSGSIADVNRYAQEYTISSSAPGSPSAGDLWYDSSVNTLKYRTSSTWASLTAGIAEIVQDVSPQLGAALDCLNNNISNCGTIDGSNLQIDFGSI